MKDHVFPHYRPNRRISSSNSLYFRIDRPNRKCAYLRYKSNFDFLTYFHITASSPVSNTNFCPWREDNFKQPWQICTKCLSGQGQSVESEKLHYVCRSGPGLSGKYQPGKYRAENPGKYRPGNKRPSGQYWEILKKALLDGYFFPIKKSYEVEMSKFNTYTKK